MYLTITPDSIELSPGGEVILRHQTWLDYENLLTSRQDNAAIKLSFNGSTGEIRLVAPLPEHGKKSDTLSDLVKALLRFQGRDWESFDPITLQRFLRRGIEPDTCFYIQNRLTILGKERIDLEVDPPPDLAIEIDLTSSTDPQDYEAIAIPELWIYRDRVLYIYGFDGQQYQASETSLTFPEFSIKSLLPPFVEQVWQTGSSVALRAFEANLRDRQ